MSRSPSIRSCSKDLMISRLSLNLILVLRRTHQMNKSGWIQVFSFGYILQAIHRNDKIIFLCILYQVLGTDIHVINSSLIKIL